MDMLTKPGPSLESKAVPSLRAEIRAATRRQHHEVEAGFDALLKQSYGRFLRGTAAAVLPLEDALSSSGFEEVLPDWRERRRGGALRADLAVLGLPDPDPAPPRIDPSPSFLAGVAYVLEGSRLGGTIILRHVLASGSEREKSATSYLAHGSGQPLWSRFWDHLEGSAALREAPERMMEGARFAFAGFKQAAATLSKTPIEEVTVHG